MEAQARAQHAAARGFEHRVVHGGIFQHKLGADAAGAVAFLQLHALNVNAVGGGEPNFVAFAGHQVRDEARGGGFAVGAGHGNNGNARGGPGRKQHVDHRGRHVARQPFGGRNVHAEARRGVYLNHGAAAFVERHGNVVGHQVDAADVEAHDAGYPLGQEYVVGVHLVGDVTGRAAGADVGRALQVHGFARRQHRLQGQALAFQDVGGVLVGLNGREHFFVAHPRGGLC
jgi:hypothetical protein